MRAVGAQSQTQSPFLITVQGTFSSDTIVELSWNDPETNTRDFTTWRSVKRQFGNSDILSPPHHAGTLFSRADDLRNQQATTIFLRVKKLTQTPAKEVMHEIVTRPDIWCRNLPSMTLRSLLSLLVQFKKTSSSLQPTATARVQTALKARYGFSRLPKMTLRIPEAHKNHTATFRKAFQRIVEATTLITFRRSGSTTRRISSGAYHPKKHREKLAQSHRICKKLQG